MDWASSACLQPRLSAFANMDLKCLTPRSQVFHLTYFYDNQGNLVMICSILAHTRTPILSNNLPMLLGLHLHSMVVKRRTINVLAGLGITSSYWSVNARRGELADIGKVTSLLRI